MSISIVTFLFRLTFLALRLVGGVATMISPFSYLYQTGAACIVPSLFRLQNLTTFASEKRLRFLHAHGRRLSVCQLLTSFPVCLRKLVNQRDDARISDFAPTLEFQDLLLFFKFARRRSWGGPGLGLLGKLGLSRSETCECEQGRVRDVS